MSADSIQQSVVVTLPPERAFAVLAGRLGSWWPAEYTWAQDGLEDIAIEPWEGGRCYERGPHGFQCDWGRVLVWEPPDRLVFSWQIGPDRVPVPDSERAGEVEVLFSGQADGTTRVELEHRGFERHGEGAEEYRDAMASEQGWPRLLDRFAAAAAAA